MSDRPNYYDENITRKVAQKLLPRLTQWTEGYGTAAELENELSEAIQRSAPWFDAYDLAQYLEKRYQWASDAQLVDILDAVATEASSVLREAIAEWVIANGIRPRQAIGDMVDVPPRDTDPELAQFKGEIVGIDEEHATYKVFVPGRGHVKTGIGIHAHILPFEAFHDLATPAEEFTLVPQ